MAFEPIENYGVIGNMQSIALVGMNGSIDFLCYPNFDSPTVFAALLDDRRGGRFEVRPQLRNMRIRQLYLPDTNILLTRLLRRWISIPRKMIQRNLVEILPTIKPIHNL